MLSLQVIYVANILVAGWIGITALFYPQTAARVVFQRVYPATELLRLVGSLWLAIALLSVLGLWRPLPFAAVLVLQLVYKSSWLAVVAVPAMRHKRPYPPAMAGFFLAWVVVLPLVIPWRALLGW